MIFLPHYMWAENNKPERPKSALYLRLKKRKVFKIVKRANLWAFLNSSLLRNMKKNEGVPLALLKNFRKNQKMRFLNSVTVPKNVRGWTVLDFLTPSSCRLSKQLKRGLFGVKKIFKKSFIVPKKSKLKTPR